jgi:hypothetical protein
MNIGGFLSNWVTVIEEDIVPRGLHGKLINQVGRMREISLLIINNIKEEMKCVKFSLTDLKLVFHFLTGNDIKAL